MDTYSETDERITASTGVDSIDISVTKVSNPLDCYYYSIFGFASRLTLCFLFDANSTVLPITPTGGTYSLVKFYAVIPPTVEEITPNSLARYTK